MLLPKLLTACLAITLILSGCSSKPNKAELSNLGELPEWVVDPEVKGTIAAVGIAPKSPGGISFQIPKAEADARANIAAQISTEGSRLSKSALRDARINDVNDVEDVFTQATKNIVKKVNLMGARRVNIYKSPVDESLYIQMAIDSEMVAKYLADNKEIYTEQLAQAKLGRERINAAEKAVESLFQQLDKELN